MSPHGSSEETTPIPNGQYEGIVTYCMFVKPYHKLRAQVKLPNGQNGYADRKYSDNGFKAMLNNCKSHSFSDLKQENLLISVEDNEISSIDLLVENK